MYAVKTLYVRTYLQTDCSSSGCADPFTMLRNTCLTLVAHIVVHPGSSSVHIPTSASDAQTFFSAESPTKLRGLEATAGGPDNELLLAERGYVQNTL